MPCMNCNAARQAPDYRMHCPSCIFCGARLIQSIQRLDRPREEIRDRCRAVLSDWIAMGHDEQALRALAKGPRALEPESSDGRGKRGG